MAEFGLFVCFEHTRQFDLGLPLLRDPALVNENQARPGKRKSDFQL